MQSKNVGVINAAPVSMGLYTNRGPPEWHPASDDVKRVAGVAKTYITNQGKRMEDVALGFGLHPENLAVSTTLVSMPNEEILKTNLEIATTPRTVDDRELYKNVLEIFKSNLKGPGHWEGKEVMEYKKALNLA